MAIMKEVLNNFQDQAKSLQSETLFINAEGVLDLFVKSHKPIAIAMQRWFVYEVPMQIVQSVAVAKSRSTVCRNPNTLFPFLR